MKLFFISSIFPSRDSPARGTFNFELCSALKRLDVDVKVICPQAWPEVLRMKRRGEKPAPTTAIEDRGLSVCYPTYWYPPKVLRSQYGTFYWNSIQNSVKKTLDDWMPDVILSYWAHPDGEAGSRLGDLLDRPSAVIVGGSDVLVLPQEAGRGEKVASVLKNSTRVFTVSQGLAKVVHQFGVAQDRIKTVYQGVDTNHFRIGDAKKARLELGLKSDGPIFLWVGRMVAVKNLEMLLEVAEKKRKQGDDFQICLAGDGPLRPRIEQLIADKSLERCVRLVGSLSHQELPKWYQAADATLLCSHSEGLPNVLRESIACGTPFISTNVGSIREIADPTCSRLVEPGDVDGFAQAIDAVLQGDCKKQTGQLSVRSWDDMAAEVCEIFAPLIPQGTRFEKPAGTTGVGSAVRTINAVSMSCESRDMS